MRTRAILVADVPPRAIATQCPASIAHRLGGRTKHALGDVFGLRNFGVNRTDLAPGARSALHHAHSVQDEFVLVLEGTPTLVRGDGEEMLRPGMCVDFSARRSGTSHREQVQR